MTVVMLPARAFAADGETQLLLPLVAAVALGASAVTGAHHASHGAGLWIIPPRMHIPDLYAVDFDRDPAEFAEAIDTDRMLSLDLLPRAHRGWMPALVYDHESTYRVRRQGSVVRLSVEYDF